MKKHYLPQETEESRYRWWESEGYFKPSKTGPPFSMVMPPPNVTGILHIGHALDNTLQDIIVRFKRMNGFNTLWVPGMDHAGIATQNVVEKTLSASGKNRHDLGREKFLETVWDWKTQYGGRISQQLRRLGVSVDWTHERFTMDEGSHKAVLETFISLHKKGYLYRGERIINFCPRCCTALSDVEVEHQDSEGHLWHITYTHPDGTAITVATTRPETMFGDTAIVVHPEDTRYHALIGKTVFIPLTQREIPILADTHVDPSLGSGAVKVTPAHDPNDFEIGERHQLPRILIMTKSACMNDKVPLPYQGLDRYTCRNQVIKDLKSSGHLIKTVTHQHSVGQCYRCQTIIEPYLSKQWFIAMKDLVRPAIDAVKNGSIQITPKRWEKLYFEWMDGIRDWCVSRQIWWGHQLPVYYLKDNPDSYIVSKNPPKDIEKYVQDTDVLDTWFSSALWPFSTLGWPEKTSDLKTYYPTNMLITGYDIMTFWVSRMITMGFSQTQTHPFSQVYIHGLVRDIHGKKMSKSLGNAMDPLALIDAHGADALRFGLASLATQGGQDIKLSEEKIIASRNFANKVWNSSRYILLALADYPETLDLSLIPAPKTLADQWIMSIFYDTLDHINEAYRQYNFAKIADKLWVFIWDYFCDWYIESSKINRQESLPILGHLLIQILTLLHPYMPFITEEVWQLLRQEKNLTLPKHKPSLSQCAWPNNKSPYINPIACQNMAFLMPVIKEIRALRKALNITPKTQCNLIVQAKTDLATTYFKKGAKLLQHLAKVSNIQYLGIDANKPPQSVSSVIGDTTFYISLEGLLNIADEQKRLEKKRDTLVADIEFQDKKLKNPHFVQKAPASVVQKIQEKKKELVSAVSALEQQLNQLT